MNNNRLPGLTTLYQTNDAEILTMEKLDLYSKTFRKLVKNIQINSARPLLCTLVEAGMDYNKILDVIFVTDGLTGNQNI